MRGNIGNANLSFRSPCTNSWIFVIISTSSAALLVLFEGEKGGLWQGHAPNHMVFRAEDHDLHNCLHNVRITGVAGTSLIGVIVYERKKRPPYISEAQLFGM